MSENQEPHANLENWTMLENAKGVVKFHGQIYGDKKGRFNDGEWVTTSPAVVRYYANDTIHTLNSIYKLGRPANA